MKKCVKIISFIILICLFTSVISVIQDKRELSENVIRLHVIANSDSIEDQSVKRKVRDAIMSYLSPGMADIMDIAEARIYLESHLEKLCIIAADVLDAEGMNESVRVTFKREAYPIREYECFTLPSGVYHSLKVELGDGVGKNWWCVVFPSLCMSAADDAAVSVFSDSLNQTIQNERDYEIRFWLLDWLGSIENFFYTG